MDSGFSLVAMKGIPAAAKQIPVRIVHEELSIGETTLLYTKGSLQPSTLEAEMDPHELVRI